MPTIKVDKSNPSSVSPRVKVEMLGTSLMLTQAMVPGGRTFDTVFLTRKQVRALKKILDGMEL